MAWTVYKHTNKINGKSYIGQTNQKPKERWDNGEGYKTQTKFYRAIKRYGWNNFSHEILAKGIETVELANEIEMYYIQFYNSVKHGYNTTLGGDNREHLGVPIIQIDMRTLKPIKEWKSIKDACDSLNLKTSNLVNCLQRKTSYVGDWYWCYKHEFKNWKPRMSQLTRPKMRPIYCLEKNKSYTDINELLKDLGIPNKSKRAGYGVYECCNKKQLTYFGYHFCFEDERNHFAFKDSTHKAWSEEEIAFLEENYQKIGLLKCCEALKRSKASVNEKSKQLGLSCDNPLSIQIYCSNNNTVYNSARQASNQIGLSVYKIKRCCDSGEECGGYSFSYFNGETAILDMNPKFLSKEIGRQKQDINVTKVLEPRSKSCKVLCVETNSVFNSIGEASRIMRINKNAISSCLRRKPHYKTAGGYHWDYADKKGSKE